MGCQHCRHNTGLQLMSSLVMTEALGAVNLSIYCDLLMVAVTEMWLSLLSPLHRQGRTVPWDAVSGPEAWALPC